MFFIPHIYIHIYVSKCFEERQKLRELTVVTDGANALTNRLTDGRILLKLRQNYLLFYLPLHFPNLTAQCTYVTIKYCVLSQLNIQFVFFCLLNIHNTGSSLNQIKLKALFCLQCIQSSQFCSDMKLKFSGGRHSIIRLFCPYSHEFVRIISH